MQRDEISKKTQALLVLLEKHLGVRSKTLDKAVRRAGRRLPRGLRAKAAELVAAQKMAAHPKLARRVDQASFDAAFKEIEAYLVGIDLAEQRKTKLLNMLALVVLNLLMIGIGTLVFLRWRGLV